MKGIEIMTVEIIEKNNIESIDKNRKSNKTTALDAAAMKYFADKSDDNKHDLVEAAKGLVRHFARIYGGGCRLDDLVQSGMEGLMKAINNFKPEMGASFVTYASHCVIGEIRHFARKEASYYTPGCIEGLKAKVHQFTDEYMDGHDTMPSFAEIADALEVREESLSPIMSAGLVSFDKISVDNIKSSHYQSFHLPIEDKLFLELAMKKLDTLQKKVIYSLFFLNLTQSETAEHLNLTQRQVSRIKVKSIETMRLAAA